MPKTMTDEQYYASLSRKVAGAGVIFRNEEGNILIVKPDYRDDWLLPGGSVDEDESPLTCAVREVAEEIGLAISNPRLVGICYSKKVTFSDSFTFFFDGGVLKSERIAEIILQENELLEYRFVPLEVAQSLMSSTGRICLPQCLEAIESGTTAYIEK